MLLSIECLDFHAAVFDNIMLYTFISLSSAVWVNLQNFESSHERYKVVLSTAQWEGCQDGIVSVGGHTPSGLSSKVSLLRQDGWCDYSGYPDLPEPLELTKVSQLEGGHDHAILVCGFTVGSPCKYTHQGAAAWTDLVTSFDNDTRHHVAGSFIGKQQNY